MTMHACESKTESMFDKETEIHEISRNSTPICRRKYNTNKASNVTQQELFSMFRNQLDLPYQLRQAI